MQPNEQNNLLIIVAGPKVRKLTGLNMITIIFVKQKVNIRFYYYSICPKLNIPRLIIGDLLTGLLTNKWTYSSFMYPFLTQDLPSREEKD